MCVLTVVFYCYLCKERTTQTQKYLTKSQQTNVECGTQMARVDYLDDGGNDRIMYSGPVHMNGDDIQQVRQSSSISIQCFIRSCFAYRRLKNLIQTKQNKIDQHQAELQAAADVRERLHRRQLDRRLNPRTASDFKLLHGELAEWKHSESERIKSSDDSQQVINEKLQLLLHKEVKLLQTIDKLKHHAAVKAKNNKIHNQLTMMCSPKGTNNNNNINVYTQRVCSDC